MAFKKVKDYNDERYSGLFLLRDDEDFADVIFLYPSVDDVLIADTHYINSSEYVGYAHCCGKGCPACAKGIRVQTKLFIPLYNLNDNEIQFWDRSVRFEHQLNADVFKKFPNPSEFVFRIIRHGAANDMNTTYQIQAVGKNSTMSYDKILSDNGITLPDGYSKICKEIPASDMFNMLNVQSTSDSYSGSEMNDYQVTPRKSTSSSSNSIPDPSNMTIPELENITDYEPLDDVSMKDIENTEELDQGDISF